MKTLVLSGSIRSNKRNLDDIFDAASKAATLPEYRVFARQVSDGRKDPICNSDVLSGAVVMGMRAGGAIPEAYSLRELFAKPESRVHYHSGGIVDPELLFLDIKRSELKMVMDEVSSAQGIVLVSPVYFGDRSSVANKILQISGMKGLLGGKVFGAAAVGAKRNGGQETTVIYCLMEALSQNALVIGNGPPTSQYGGTAVGGHRGTVIDDEWGLDTAFGTGHRVAEVCALVGRSEGVKLTRPAKILILALMDDKKSSLLKFLSSYVETLKQSCENVEFGIVNVLDSTIYRCLGCDTCPASEKFPLGKRPTPEEHSQCLIRRGDDAMETIHVELLRADAIVLAGLNVKDHASLVYRYQVMVERTRFIRRNNFELNNKLVTAFSLNQVGARINSLHSIKTVTSYIRHNTIIHKPIEVFSKDGTILDDGKEDFLSFVNWAKTVAVGSEQSQGIPPRYTTSGIGGY